MIGQYTGNAQGFFIFGLILSLFTSVSSYYWSDRLVLMMAQARPADKKEYFNFYTVTENLTIAAGMPMPKLYVIQDPTPNAFATGRDDTHAVVAATTGLLDRLDRTEIEGVIAHELSHIRNRDMLVSTVVAVLVGTLVYVTDFTLRSMWWGGRDNDSDSKNNPLTTVLFFATIIVTPILASLLQMAVSRKREYMADASGALLTRNPDALADALEKIADDRHVSPTASNAIAHLYFSNPFGSNGTKGQWLMNLFSTHPPIEERVRILRAM